MTYQQTQCLIFCSSVRRLEMHLEPVCTVTRSSAAGLSTRIVKVVALLPEAFCNSHQSVVSRFKKNGVHILRHGDEVHIVHKDICVIECLLEENPDDEVDSPTMLFTSNGLFSCIYHLQSSFDKNSLKLIMKHHHTKHTTNDALTRPAIDDQNTDIFQRLLRGSRYNGYMNLLSAAVSEGLDFLVKLSLDHGADVEARCSDGRTALHVAASLTYDSSKLVQLLIDKGASVNPKSQTDLTPLHTTGNPGAAKVLLENGADLNCVDRAKINPLLNQIYSVTRNGKSDVIKILLDYGAHIELRFASEFDFTSHAFVGYMIKRVLEYLLNRCFVHVDFENGNKRPISFRRVDFSRSRIIARHLVRVVSLKLKDRYSFDAADFWAQLFPEQPLSAYKEQCEMEVSRMKSQLIAGTDLSVYDLLAKDEHQVARLLRNQSVTVDTNELQKMFPEYGLILTYAVEKGRNRLAWHEQGIVSCNLLSPNFKRMPDEIKENIVSPLSIIDIRSVKRASAFLS